MFFFGGPFLDIYLLHFIRCFLPFGTGQALVEAGESYKHLAEIKYNLEDNVKQNFIEPLTQMQNKDLKEVNVRTKLLNLWTLYVWLI